MVGVSGQRYHHTARLIALVHFLVAQGDAENGDHSVSYTRVHGGFALDELFVEQEVVASDACIDSI